MNYQKSLEILKETLLPNRENSILASIVKKRFPEGGDITILDVGGGDGTSLKKMINILGKDYKFTITIVEPLRNNTTTIGATVSKTKFEKFKNNQKYDIVIFKHVLYYFSDLSATLQKASDCLKNDGLLLVTIWSDDCILKELHNKLLSRSRNTLDIASIKKAWKLIIPKSRHSIYECKSKINVKMWKDSEKVRRAVLKIISRKVLSPTQENLLVKKLSALISKLNNTVKRSNTIIKLQK